MSSTELIQEKEAAEKHTERNPEMEVGGDGVKQAEWSSTVGWIRQRFNLQNAFLESGGPS